MSLYQLSKLLYTLNRDPKAQARFRAEPDALLAEYRLTDEERGAMRRGDVGLLYVLGVNGQILMHFAAFCGVEWNDYLQQMRDGIKAHGQVRDGVYALMSSPDEKVVK